MSCTVGRFVPLDVLALCLAPFVHIFLTLNLKLARNGSEYKKQSKWISLRMLNITSAICHLLICENWLRLMCIYTYVHIACVLILKKLKFVIENVSFHEIQFCQTLRSQGLAHHPPSSLYALCFWPLRKKKMSVWQNSKFEKNEEKRIWRVIFSVFGRLMYYKFVMHKLFFIIQSL